MCEPADSQVKTEILQGGTRLYTDEAHPVTTDSLLLAAFCPLRPAWRVCDLGCGGGVLLLSLAGRGHTGPAVGVDVDEGGLSLLRTAAADGGLGSVTAICANWNIYATARPFDLVVCNPPYYTAGPASVNPTRARARHARSGDGPACGNGSTPPAGGLQGACLAAARILKDGGRFCLCWPAGALAGLFAALAAAGLAPKRLRLVRKAPGAAPRLALAEARKGGGEGLEILPDLFINQQMEGG
jgi:tRNA1(Val) A37 N6-methylase TrmN6